MNIFKRALRSFLWRSGIGRRAAKAFWHRKAAGEGMRYLYYKKEAVIPDLPMCFDEEVFNHFLKTQLNGWEIQDQAEFILEADNVLVEPERCLGSQGYNELIEQTVVFTADYQYPYILPHLLNRKSARFIKEAVLYDGSATRNLYHHLVETVGRLSLLEKAGLPAGIPILVNRFVYSTAFFQDLLRRSDYIRSLNWMVLDKNDWLRVGKLYRMKAFYFGKENWTFTRRMYNLPEVVPSRRVFLSRDKKLFTRALANEAEVFGMLKQYGFEIAYAEHLTMEEQIRLFQETEYLIALTGMGLVQQFFMDYDRAHIIEIIPVNRLMPEYYCEAFSLGIKYYDVVLGDDVDETPPADGSHRRIEGVKEYVMNVDKLERAVRKMLGAPKDKKVYGNCQLSAN